MQTELPLPEPANQSAQVLSRVISAQSEMSAAMPDSEAIMRVVTRNAMAMTGATSASIGLRDGDDMVMPVSEGFTSSLEGGRFPMASTLLGHCLISGEQYYVPDLQLLSVARGEIARAAGIRAFLAVPLRHQDNIVAALSIAAPQPYAFNEDALLSIRLLSRLAGSKLAHAQAFQELRAAVDEATRARAEVVEFAGMIAHELGSPIAAIQNAVDVLGVWTLEPQQEHARALIATETRALRMLVGDLRVAAALEREAFSVHRQIVLLDALVTEASNFAQTFDTTHPVHVQLGSPLKVEIDPGRIAQVLRNLVTNAVKYTPTGSPIEIRAWREEEMARVAVADHGPGIAEEHQELIFTRFGRAQHRMEHKVPGLGLGLYLSRRIVEAHGGQLTVASTPGAGATFTFSVPLAA
jgi:signal transduction histidine kinase